MNGIDVVRQTYQTSLMVMKSYLSDLSDDELFTRPGDGCNHPAWQIGHLLASEVSLVESICPGKGAKLPDGFEEMHSKETSSSDDKSAFCNKDEYMTLIELVGQATMAALDASSDEDLDQPGPERFAEMFPTVGSIWVLIATHWMMHAGQLVPVRRKLDKPILM